MNIGERQVELDQYFPLFLPAETTVFKSIPNLRRTIVLNMTDPTIDLSIDIIAASKIALKLEAVTPCSPEIGYEIDERDYHLLARLRKCRQYFGQFISLSQAPLRLIVRSEAVQNNIVDLSKLRFAAVFPKIAYEAKPVEKALRQAELVFEYFYPATQGPLATPPPQLPHLISDCLVIQLPWDSNRPIEQNLNVLQPIKGSFYLDNGIPWSFRRSFG